MNKYEFAIKYEDTSLTFKNILRNYSKCSFLRYITLALLPFIQIYFLNPVTYTYAVHYFIKSILFSITTIVNEISLEYLNNHMNKKDYYQLGSLVRKIIIWSVLVSTVVYFPTMLVCSAMTGLTNYTFFIINFFTLIMYSVNLALFNMIYTFQKNELILNLLSVSKIVMNVIFLLGLNRRGLLYMTTTALSDFLTELVYLILIFFVQHRINPYPQAWSKLTPDMFILSISFLKTLRLHACILWIFTYCNEISLIIYMFLFESDVTYIMLLILLKELLFNPVCYAKRIYPEKRKDELLTNLHKDGLDNSGYLLQRYLDFRMKSLVAVNTIGLVLLLTAKLLFINDEIALFQIFIIYIVAILQNIALDIVKLKIYNLTSLQVLKYGIPIWLGVFLVSNLIGQNSFLFFLYSVLFIYFISNQYNKII
jgi:hypothetical protein